jgi:hypothetical protein
MMTLKRLLLACLIASVGFAGCSDDDGEGSDNNGQVPVVDVDDGDVETGVVDAEDDAEDGGDDPDADTPDTDGPDADDPDADDPDADADLPDADRDGGDDVDADPPEGCQPGDDLDSDHDGLLDCEEEQMCTDPFDADTDNDGLTDLEELLLGTDACNADTSGDGISDGDKVDLGLDPTTDVSFNDGVNDADRWVIRACDAVDEALMDASPGERAQCDGGGCPEPINFYTNPSNLGNWKAALPPAFNNYADLTIAGADINNRHAAAVYDDPSNEVTAFLMSAPPTANDSTRIVNNYKSDINSVSSIEQDFVGGDFPTHDYFTATLGQFRVETSTPISARELRDQLLFAMAPFGESDTSGLPSSAGAPYDDFRINVSVVYRDYQDGSTQAITSVALAPTEKYESRDKVQFRMNDLSNTTHIASASDGDLMRCDVFEPQESAKADFYWVLDHSGSMNTHNSNMAALANDFFNQLANAGIDYRLGVTMMNDWDGRLRPQAGWHTDLNTFNQEVAWVVGENGAYEWGLRDGKRGIEYMKHLTNEDPGNHRMRPDATTITIWISDEETEYISSNGINTAAGQTFMQEMIDFYPRHAVGFSITGDGGSCGFQDGEAYRIVSQATGGADASLCAADYQETFENIIHAATGYGGYDLPDTPISSSIRVFVEGEWVPRSRTNGFDYFERNNTIAFFGDYLPEVAEGGNPPDYVSISYESFRHMSKEQ